MSARDRLDQVDRLNAAVAPTESQINARMQVLVIAALAEYVGELVTLLDHLVRKQTAPAAPKPATCGALKNGGLCGLPPGHPDAHRVVVFENVQP